MIMVKVVLLATGVITVIIILLFAKILIIPTFLLSKTSQQMLQGENCGQLNELWQRNKCYSSAASVQKDSSVCEQIIISEEDKTSAHNKMLCYKNVAVRTKNPSLCRLAGQFQGECESESK